MARGIKFKGLLEQAMGDGITPPLPAELQTVPTEKLPAQYRTPEKGPRAYRRHVRHMLGLQENEDNGQLTLNKAAQALDPHNISFRDIAEQFLGREFGASDLRAAMNTGQMLRLQEAEGHTVLPSHFASISAFTDTVSGLIDVLALEGYTSPDFMGDEFMTIRDARVQGGKRIGARNDGGAFDDLAVNEPYPTVGARETYVHIPDNRRRGNTIQINEFVFTYDRTDQVQQLATGAGYAVRRLREIDQADTVQGKTNKYMRDGVYSNTYRLTAGTTAATDNAGPNAPMGYVNAKFSTPLNDWQDWNIAKQTLSKNTDPATGFEIAVNPRQSILLVSPDNELLAYTIVNATGIQTRAGSAVNTGILTQASAVQLNIRNSANPLSEFGISIRASRIWYNRLRLAGTNSSGFGSSSSENDATVVLGAEADHAPSVWLWGDFKRAFEYRQIVPFATESAPLSSEDVRRDIVSVYVAREVGVAWVLEPRYVFLGAQTYTT